MLYSNSNFKKNKFQLQYKQKITVLKEKRMSKKVVKKNIEFIKKKSNYFQIKEEAKT